MVYNVTQDGNLNSVRTRKTGINGKVEEHHGQLPE